MSSLSRCGLSGYYSAVEVIERKEALQKKWELIALVGLVRSLRPDIVVEIGTYRGGTLRCWSQVAPQTAALISIDLPGGLFGGGYTEEDVQRFKASLKPRQSLHCIRDDSHRPQTLAQVEQLLEGRAIDFLFIDGDHSYEGVRLDFEMYSPLVRSGGLIAFHDIRPHPVHQSCKVHEFWAEVRDRYRAYDLTDRDGNDWGGIGVLVKA